MIDTDSDEDLKRAIALSLAEQSLASSSQKAVVVDLVSSDEDDDLDAPVTTKRIISTKMLSDKKDKKIPSEKYAAHTEHPAATCGGRMPSPEANGSLSGSSTKPSFLGLDRKKMEEARLLRAQQRKEMAQRASMLETDAGKRKASSSPPHPSGLSTRLVKPKLSELAPSPTSAASKTLPILPSKDQERALQYLGVQFPDGVVKKTWVYDCHRQDDIKIEEVLQKDDLELAVLSSFQIDPDWVASKLHPTTKVVFVLQARTEIEVGSLAFSSAVSIFYVLQTATPRSVYECARPRGRSALL